MNLPTSRTLQAALRPTPTGRWRTSFVLFALLAGPSLPLYLAGASSMTTGLIAAALLPLALLPGRLREQASALDVPHCWLLAGLLFVLLHFLLIMPIEPVDITRFALSYALLLYFAAAAMALAPLLFHRDSVSMERVIQPVFLLMTACGLVGTLGIAPPSASYHLKPVFPFTEPSHFALAYIPLLMFTALRARPVPRYLWLGLGFAIGFLLENLTLLVGSSLVLLLCSRGVALAAALGVLAFVATRLDLEYFVLRLDFSGQVQNLSNLAFVQGWQLIGESLERSAGYGLGFQQLGQSGTNVLAADLIYAMTGSDFNLTDGGFTFAKLASEFGYIGIGVTALLYTPMFLRTLWQLRRSAACPLADSATLIFARCVVASFAFDLFLRGVGYFSGTSLLFVAALLSMRRLSAQADRSLGALARPPSGRRRARRSAPQPAPTPS